MNKHSLKVEERKVLGKAVKTLRKSGLLPGNIYGKDVKSTAIQVSLAEFQKVHKEAGETGIVEVDLNGKKVPTLIKNIAYDYINDVPLHVDFYQVNLSEKVKAQIPIELIGEPKAVTEKLGLLLQVLNQIEVEALPADLPEKIEVNVEHLANVDDAILVENLKVSSGVEILTPKEEMVVKISEPTKEEVVETPAPAEGEEAAEGETAAAEGEEGKAAEGTAETPKEEEKK